jgi:hypothetical protein
MESIIIFIMTLGIVIVVVIVVILLYFYLTAILIKKKKNNVKAYNADYAKKDSDRYWEDIKLEQNKLKYWKVINQIKEHSKLGEYSCTIIVNEELPDVVVSKLREDGFVVQREALTLYNISW